MNETPICHADRYREGLALLVHLLKLVIKRTPLDISRARASSLHCIIMSNIYITEPPTNGKVLLKTSLGDIDIELWSKEAPLASRNFVQLCMEGYYNETVFHRVIEDFVAQGGDPTGTGEGGESIYGKPFKDEFHQRLKFSRRGLVAMVNGGPNDNGSQFFFSLGRADELNHKHTIFGKITGNTLYNLVKFNEIPTDKSDRPREPIKVFRTEILNNPFNDIVPRENRRIVEKRAKEKQKSQSKATKDFGLLSFGEEAEEEEEEINKSSNRIVSSHDVLSSDPVLASEPAVTMDELRQSRKRTNNEEIVNETKKEKLSLDYDDEEDDKISKMESLKLRSKQLKKEIKQAKKQREQDDEAAKEKERLIPEAVRDLKEQQLKYAKLSQKYPRTKKEREASTLEMLAKFKTKMTSARQMAPPQNEMVLENIEDEREDILTNDWLTHQLVFDSDEKLALAKDPTKTNTEDFYDIYDPRNTLNVRRREAQNTKPTTNKQKQ